MAIGHPFAARIRANNVHAQLAAALGAVLVASIFLFVAAPAASATVARGLVEHRIEVHGGIDLAPVPSYAEEIGRLNAKWVRVLCYWDQMQPYAPGDARWAGLDSDGDGYNDSYVTELDTVVQALRDQGLKVILTGSDPPAWTRDTRYQKYWSGNITTAVVRMRDARVSGAFRGFAKFVAEHYATFGVQHFEVWNEPNLRLIPQIAGGRVIGPEVYRQMLIAFSKGAHAGNSSAVVIAGATSRFGSDGTDPGSTSPQWFARYLKSHGALRWFDAYSHHPYTVRGSKDLRPSALPPRPKLQVTLGNLPVLLRLFPTKPFYLTEYCYSTGKKDAFLVMVSKADQARYLRQAYALVNTRAYRQVKVLLWFLVRDWQAHPETDPEFGVFSGLVDYNGLRKPAWYAFAGENRLTIQAPDAAAAGSPFDITGVLTTSEGPTAEVKVQLQRRSLTGTVWQTVTGVSAKTDATGAYSLAGITQTSGKRYRVIWDGVVESSQVTVALAR